MITQIINGRILTPHGWLEGGSVLIKDTRIEAVLNHNNRVAEADKVIDAKGAYVLPGTEDFGDYLTSKGIVVSLGHTAATPEDVERGYKHGFNHATHFYNAMTGNHKEGVYKHAGTIEAVYINDGITVEMIADGIHVPPTLLQMIYKVKGPGKTALITDALAVAASDSKTAFDPRVIIEDGVCKLADRSAIAGSIATMDRLVRTAVQKAGIPLADVSRMASETPARIMGVYDRKGSIEAGKDADIMMFDKDLNLTGVVQMGREVAIAD